MLLSKKHKLSFVVFIVSSSLILSQTLVIEDVLTKKSCTAEYLFFPSLHNTMPLSVALHKLHLSAKNSPPTPLQLAGRKHSLSLK